MGVLDREEINGFTKEQVDAAKESINANTDAEISAAIETLQTATGAARDAILEKLGSGGSSVIKSIQRGVITISSSSISASATISAVNMNKTMVNWLGTHHTMVADTDDNQKYVGLELTNSTTVTATRGGSGRAIFVSYEVVEFN